MNSRINSAIAYAFEQFKINFNDDNFFDDKKSPLMLNIEKKEIFLFPIGIDGLVLTMALAYIPHLSNIELLRLLQEAMVLNAPQWNKPIKYYLDKDQHYLMLSSKVVLTDGEPKDVGEKLTGKINEILSVYENSISYLKITPVQLIND